MKATTNSIYPKATATVLYKERRTVFEYKYEVGFYVVNEYFTRLKIYNKDGYDNATHVISLYHESELFKEFIANVKGVTYSLINGEIVKTKLDDKNIFENKKNKYWNEVSFTMPNLSEGCVVEWLYTIESPIFSRIDEISIQENIPVAKTYNKISIPEYFVYKEKPKGYLNIPIKRDKKERTITYNYHDQVNNIGGFRNVRGTDDLKFQEIDYVVDMVNIPPIENEPYCGNIKNFTASVLFELSYTEFPNKPLEYYSIDWESLSKKIYESEDFGQQIKQSNYLEDIIPNILSGVNASDEKMKVIYKYIQTNLQHNNLLGYYTDLGVKKSFKEKIGNTADINLNLINMLRAAKIDANPVLVSTTDNGVPMFPSIIGFNYVIVKANINGNSYLLDATNPFLIPGLLPYEILNFQGREIKSDGSSEWVNLFPEEHSVSKVFLFLNFDENKFLGNLRSVSNNHKALQYREKYATIYENKSEMIKKLSEQYNNIDVIDYRISNMTDYYKEYIENIKFETDSYFEKISGKTYINPLVFLQYEPNIFKLEKREFPIYFKTPYIEQYLINFIIPEHLNVESIPESADYTLPEDMGKYTITFNQNEQKIEVTSTLIINNPVVPATHYNDLKTFFETINLKQAEKIVLTSK